MSPAPIELRSIRLDWSHAYVVGVVNVTPDSFSDGGRYLDPVGAVAHGRALHAAGAAIIDVGGESTRPTSAGQPRLPLADELERVLPVVRGLAREGIPVSIDTTRAAVARAALDAGAELVNDISGGGFDPDLVEVTAAAGAVLVCGHARGHSIAEVHAGETAPPGFAEVATELCARVVALPARLRHRTVVDPGLGFGKRGAENLELLARAGELAAACGCPVMVGPSRKRFLGELTGRPVDDRDAATVGACLAAVAGGAHLVRVHDVAGLVPALRVFEAARRGGTVA